MPPNLPAGPITAQEAIDRVKASDAIRVKLAITDVDGVLRGKYVHKEKFLSAATSGFGFCNVVFGWDMTDVCYDNATYTGWHSGYPDAQAVIDLSTYREVPWHDNVPFLLADFQSDEGKPLVVCPRQLLKTVVGRAKAAGLQPLMSTEYEWFNFRESPQTFADKGHIAPQPLTPGMFGYSLTRLAQNHPFIGALFDEMAAFRVPLEGLHTETGPGVFEAAILYDEPVEAADRAILFKAGTKEIAHRFGILPSFMAKWNAQLPGCSGHIHQSIWDESTTTNLFFDAQDRHGMSETFRHYIAGQMALLPDLLALFAPTVNSYKRLTEGAWAPTKVNWGLDNRTTALRTIGGSAKSTRLETRVGGSDANPYLALAAALASGVYGIENKLALKAAPVSGNGYADRDALDLPRDLDAATTRLEQSKIARALLGDGFVDHFVATRRWEWRQYSQAVTNWELARYFEIV